MSMKMNDGPTRKTHSTLETLTFVYHEKVLIRKHKLLYHHEKLSLVIAIMI